MTRRAQLLPLVGFFALTLAGHCQAQGTGTIRVSNANNTVPSPVLVTINGVGTSVMIPPLASANTKAITIAAALRAKGYTVPPTGAIPEVVVQGLPTPVHISFSSDATSELEDRVSIPTVGQLHAVHGTAMFAAPHFAPIDTHNQPAIFTAGIVTDVGVLRAQVSASELNFQTDGPIICQALFQRLAPRAPQYGAQINYAGDRLEVYFDPAYTVTQGGIIFGTTSPSQGAGGVIDSNVPPPCPADFDGDGSVDFFDYDAFVRCFEGGPCPPGKTADFDGDGTVDFFDYDAFVQAFEQGC